MSKFKRSYVALYRKGEFLGHKEFADPRESFCKHFEQLGGGMRAEPIEKPARVKPRKRVA